MKAVNLIPNEQRGPAKASAASAATSAPGNDGFGAYAILGGLALAAAASALIATSGNGISEKKADLASIKAQTAQVTTQAGSFQAFSDFASLKSNRVATVRALAMSRFDWPRALDDVSRALPSDVYISDFDGTTTSASGGSSLRGAIIAPAIELTGCTKDQASVARMMSRLRNVRGATRVTLASSTATASTNAAIAPVTSTGDTGAAGDGKTATPKTTSQPCPKGAAPNFDAIVFFERAALQTAAVPNVSASGIGGPSGASGPSGPTGSTSATTPASATTTTP